MNLLSIRGVVILHVFLLSSAKLFSQDAYDLARMHFQDNVLDSARYYINRSLERQPRADDYFLSGMIHEAEGKDLRALADYEAVIKKDPGNLEAYFQKGLIYYNTASPDQAIKDFTYVLNNQESSETRAVYYANDPSGDAGTFLTTLQSMMSRVYQYRGMAYRQKGEWKRALQDFDNAFAYDSLVDCFINRSQIYENMGRTEEAIADLREAIKRDSLNYTAWYNLAILDGSTRLPFNVLDHPEFTPMLTLVGANAYEQKDYARSKMYFDKALETDESDVIALIGRGKTLLMMEAYGQARADFIKVLRTDPSRVEAFYLTGNSFFYEQQFNEALGFYEQYLSIDQKHGRVWYNASMALFNLKQREKACSYLKKAADLGMEQGAALLDKLCGSQ